MNPDALIARLDAALLAPMSRCAASTRMTATDAVAKKFADRMIDDDEPAAAKAGISQDAPAKKLRSQIPMPPRPSDAAW